MVGASLGRCFGDSWALLVPWFKNIAVSEIPRLAQARHRQHDDGGRCLARAMKPHRLAKIWRQDRFNAKPTKCTSTASPSLRSS